MMSIRDDVLEHHHGMMAIIEPPNEQSQRIISHTMAVFRKYRKEGEQLTARSLVALGGSSLWGSTSTWCVDAEAYTLQAILHSTRQDEGACRF